PCPSPAGVVGGKGGDPTQSSRGQCHRLGRGRLGIPGCAAPAACQPSRGGSPPYLPGGARPHRTPGASQQEPGVLPPGCRSDVGGITPGGMRGQEVPGVVPIPPTWVATGEGIWLNTP